jgi:RimJ/RimL family protein N-acetyltransferase
MVSSAPRLETPRLILRAHRRADFDDCLRLWQDSRTTRFIGGEHSDQAVWFRLLRHAGLWSLLGFGFWAIESRSSSAYLGSAGLMESKRGIAGLHDIPEAGWALMPEVAGQGLATEAMQAILAWADRNVPSQRTGCIISPENFPSLAVARKLGFREADRAELDGDPVVLCFRERPDQAAISAPA